MMMVQLRSACMKYIFFCSDSVFQSFIARTVVLVCLAVTVDNVMPVYLFRINDRIITFLNVL